VSIVIIFLLCMFFFLSFSFCACVCVPCLSLCLYGPCQEVQRQSEDQSESLWHIPPRELVDAPLNKSAWRSRCHDAVTDFEDRRVDALRSKRARRKAGVSMNPGAWVCDVCSRPCQSTPGLDYSLTEDHIDNREIRRIDGSVRRRRRWAMLPDSNKMSE